MKTLADLTQSMERARDLHAFLNVQAARALGRPLDSLPESTPGLVKLKAAVASGNLDALRTSSTFNDVVLAQSVPGRLLSLGATPAPIGLPVLSVPTDITMAEAAEGKALPAVALDVSGQPLMPTKYGFIAVFDSRSVSSLAPTASRQFQHALTQAVTRGLNNAFTAALFAAATNVTGGLPELLTVMADVQAPVFITSLVGLSRFATDPATADSFSNVAGEGALWGQPVLVVPSAGDRLLLVDAAKLAIYFGGIELDPGSAAAVQMDSAPTNASVPPTGTALVSMFQANAIALRAVAHLSWEALAADALAFITAPVTP